MATDRRLWFTHKCRFCNYVFVSEKDLVHHEATHDTPDFACDNCSSVFADAEQLSLHVKDGCSVSDSSTDIGRQHVCGTCGEIFRFVRELYKHYGEHHMTDKSSLADRKSGSIDDAMTCANCGALFSGAASLKVHLWKAHNLNAIQQPDQIQKKNGPSPCRDSDTAPSGGRLFVTDQNKPFKCSMCNWSFKYDFSYHSHLKMHQQKQRELEEMLRANCESQSSVSDNRTRADVEPDSLVSCAGKVRAPIMLFPLKRKLENGNDVDCLPGAKVSVAFDAKSAGSQRCSTTNVGTVASSGQDTVEQTAWKPVSNISQVSVVRELRCGGIAQASSEQLHPSPNASLVVMNAGNSVTRHSVQVDCSPPLREEPFRFSCKLCSFKCHYDFSYVAHLNQHDKLKELEIDDLQSHLIASSTQTPSGGHIANKYAIKVIGSGAGDVSCVKGHTQVVDSSGISYILLCPGAVDETTLVTGLPNDERYEDTVITTDAATTTDCLNSNIVPVDDVNTNMRQDLDSAARPATDDDDVDFSGGSEMQFLDLTSGETLYVINESHLPVSLPVDATSERQKYSGCEEAEIEVVLPAQPSDGQLLDVAGLCSDEDGVSDDSDSAAGEDSFTCYYCNVTFTNISQLQRHIVRLHVE